MVSVVCLCLIPSAGPEELRYRDMEQRLSQEANAALNYTESRPWEPEARERLDLAVIKQRTKNIEASTWGMQANSLMNDRNQVGDLLRYAAVGFALLWFPGLLFLWLVPKNTVRPAPACPSSHGPTSDRPRQVVDMDTLTSRDASD